MFQLLCYFNKENSNLPNLKLASRSIAAFIQQLCALRECTNKALEVMMMSHVGLKSNE